VEKGNRGLTHNERPSTSTASTTPPPIPPPPIIHPQIGQQGDGPVKNSKIVQYASLPRPMRSSPDLSNTNGGSSGRAPPGSTPPPIRASNFINQHSVSASTFSTPLGNIDEPPASLSANTSATTYTLNEVNSGVSSKHHNTPDVTVTGATAKTGNNFRASSYLAATAREVHAAKSRSVEIESGGQQTAQSHSSNNSNVMVNPVTPNGATAKTGNNFRASSYLAATAREVHAAKSRSVEIESGGQQTAQSHSSNNSNVMVNPVTPNGEAIVYRETVFGVKPRTQSTETAGRALPSNSQHDTKNTSGQAIASSSSVGNTGGEVSVLCGSISDGPDPFEVSSSVKRIASRNRYSQVFTENAKPIDATLTGGAQCVVGVSSTVVADSKQPPTTQAPKSAVGISTSAASLLPSPSPLLLGQSAAVSQTTIGSTEPIYARPRLAADAAPSAQRQQQSAGYAQLASTNPPSTSGLVHTPAFQQPKCGNVIGGQQMMNQMFYLPQQRNLTHRDSTPIMEGYARMGAINTAFPSTSATPYATLGSATGSSFGQTPYSWQLSHPLASIATRGTDVAAMNRPAFLYDANLNNSLRSTHGASLTTMNPSMNVLQPTRLSASSQRTSSVNEEILGLFDPLSSTNTSPSGVTVRSASPTKSKPVDPVDALFSMRSGRRTYVNSYRMYGELALTNRKARNCRRRKCAAMLQRCNNDVARAVRELKTDELLAMGIAKDRGQAISALAD
uniref:UBA domain-containing protein n=1 Tax=Ascaris lumbricoides TaxID=6252 RepID=A0A9J2Q9V2_ASCLU